MKTKIDHPVIKSVPNPVLEQMRTDGVQTYYYGRGGAIIYTPCKDIVRCAAHLLMDYAENPEGSALSKYDSYEISAVRRWYKYMNEKMEAGELCEEDKSIVARIGKKWGFRRDDIILYEASYSFGVCDSASFCVCGKGYATDFADLQFAPVFDDPINTWGGTEENYD